MSWGRTKEPDPRRPALSRRELLDSTGALVAGGIVLPEATAAKAQTREARRVAEDRGGAAASVGVHMVEAPVVACADPVVTQGADPPVVADHAAQSGRTGDSAAHPPAGTDPSTTTIPQTMRALPIDSFARA